MLKVPCDIKVMAVADVQTDTEIVCEKYEPETICLEIVWWYVDSGKIAEELNEHEFSTESSTIFFTFSLVSSSLCLSLSLIAGWLPQKCSHF